MEFSKSTLQKTREEVAILANELKEDFKELKEEIKEQFRLERECGMMEALLMHLGL